MVVLTNDNYKEENFVTKASIDKHLSVHCLHWGTQLNKAVKTGLVSPSLGQKATMVVFSPVKTSKLKFYRLNLDQKKKLTCCLEKAQ